MKMLESDKFDSFYFYLITQASPVFSVRCHCSQTHWHLQRRHTVFSLICFSCIRISLRRSKSLCIHHNFVTGCTAFKERQEISLAGLYSKYNKFPQRPKYLMNGLVEMSYFFLSQGSSQFFQFFFFFSNLKMSFIYE